LSVTYAKAHLFTHQIDISINSFTPMNANMSVQRAIKLLSTCQIYVDMNLFTLIKKLFYCEKCMKRFVGPSNLSKHKRIHHSGEKSFVCDVCDTGFTNTSDLRRHELSHTGERQYVCDICQLSFIYPSDLR